MIRTFCIPFFSFILCCVTVRATAQVFPHHTAIDKNIQLLCHKWDISQKHIAAGTALFPIDSLATVRFSPDGYVYFNAAKKTSGVWNYDAIRNNLYIIFNSDLWKYKILSLSENELVLENRNSQKNIPDYLKRDKQL